MRRAAALSCTLVALVACSGQDGPRSGSSAGGTEAAGGSAMPPASGSGSTTAGSAGGGAAPGGGGSAGGAASAGSENAGSSGQVEQPPSSGSKAHVITWVPPYHVQESKQQLSASFGGVGMAQGLSFLALQFWVTDGPGTRLDSVSEADISWFHDWARQHGVKILLCVDNYTSDWSWPEAVRSFRDNQGAFAQHLLDEVARRDFDGIDLDLEGIVDATADEQSAYRGLTQALADGLHPLGKVLTLDSFHGQWNAPNWNWWPDLFPIVDGITSMGYEQSGLDVDYPQLVAHAAAAPQKLMIGVPSYQGSWQGHSVTEQLGWLLEQGQVGTAIWDASLSATEWQQASVWDQLEQIKSR